MLTFICHEINFTIKYFLDSPGPPVISKFTSDVLSVNVSWDAPQDDTDGGIFDYKITILEENYRMIQQHHGIKQTFFSFQNLKQNRSYIVFLQARNIVGYGESANGTVRTLEAGKEYEFCQLNSLSSPVT